MTTTGIRASGRIPLAATLAVATSAGVLFSIEPFTGKVLLPRLGGTPAVWNTCVMVFQILLLAGYGYSVLLLRANDVRRSVRLHTALVAASIVVWPFAVRALWMDPRPGWPPVAWVTVTTLAGIGLPFALLAAVSPLLQVALARRASAPINVHRLYAASNIASALGLVLYVGVLEPLVGVSRQSSVLWLGYAAAMILSLAVLRHAGEPIASRSPADPAGTPDAPEAPEVPEAPRPAARGSRLDWITISFGTSLCLYAVNTYIATDVASFPLLWCIPLGVFLLAFAAGFSSLAARARTWLIGLAQIAALAALAQLVWVEDARTVWVGLLTPNLALAALVTALAAELAHRRPPDDRLAGYYAWIGLGGVAAGITSVVVLPWIWSSVSVAAVPGLSALRSPLRTLAPLLLTETVPEYTAALLLSSWILSTGKSLRTSGRFALCVMMAIGIAVIGIRFVFPDGSPSQQWGVVGFAVACAAIGASWGMQLAAASLAVSMVGGLASLPDTETIFQARNFFGTSSVQREAGGTHRLKHGTTLHGLQPAEDPASPASYYSRASPLGQVMERTRPQHVLIAGLGVGTVAAYGQAGDRYLFLEINPLVPAIATNPQWFSYVEDARRRGASVDIEIGDARLLATGLDDGAWDLIVMDAFSSDAIPTHLLSVEAIRLLQRKLSARGILAYHISNRFFDLRDVLAAAAMRAGMSWAVQDNHKGLTSNDFESTWVMLAASEASAREAGLDGEEWERTPPPSHVEPWTDDWANVLGTMKSWKFWAKVE